MFSLFPLVVLAVILYFGVYLTLAQRRMKRLGDVDRLSSLGRDVQVLELATQMEKGWPKLAVFAWFRAISLFNLWRIREAATLATSLTLKTPPQLRHLPHELIPRTALLWAILGEQSPCPPVPPELEELGTMKLTRAVEAIRLGDFATAETLMASAAVFRVSGGAPRQLADALAAWCALELHGERRYLNRVALFGEGGPDELAQCWPEFVAALDRLEDGRPVAHQAVAGLGEQGA